MVGYSRKIENKSELSVEIVYEDTVTPFEASGKVGPSTSWADAPSDNFQRLTATKHVTPNKTGTLRLDET